MHVSIQISIKSIRKYLTKAPDKKAPNQKFDSSQKPENDDKRLTSSVNKHFRESMHNQNPAASH